MARKKVLTSVYLTPEQASRLRELSERTHVPQAVYLREGVDLVLAQHASKLAGQVALEWDD